MIADLDAADRTLLARLQEDAATPAAVLADACGLSVASVQRRLRRLKDAGVIERETAVVSPKNVGQEMTFVILVELERESTDQLNAFRRKAVKEPHVQQCYYVTGEADFVLICVASDMADFEALTERLFFDDANVRRFRTSVVMSRVKVGLSVPV